LTDATHQVRAHLAAVGFPLAVDPMYGDRTSLSLSDLKRGYASKPGRRERPILERTALHGRLFECELPSGRTARAECAAPDDLTRLVAALERYRAPFDLDDGEAP
jgi:23S rRNA-/tRNA-specific pseudouridylate synthase